MIDEKNIQNAIYELCVLANTTLNDDVFCKISDAYKTESCEDAKQALGLILKNAKMAALKKMPLCQDTGQVLVFAKAKEFAKNFSDIVNQSIAKAYEENYFRKSIVKNALFDRINTKTNTPCVLYTEIADIEGIELSLLVKGAGSENVCAVEMISPTASQEDVIDTVLNIVKRAGSKGCPPYFIGIGIGGTIDYATVLSKKALLLEKDIDENHKNLSLKIKNAINELKIGAAGLGGDSTALDVKIISDFTHIACMPVAVTINCHSSRHYKCLINNDKIVLQTPQKVFDYETQEEDFSDFVKINTDEIDRIRNLKKGQKVLLSGEIYSARDAAHKRIVEMLENSAELPFDLKNKIIFYAGPCPCKGDCVVGSIGPTTASRMDKFALKLYENGVLATIGKGERSLNIEKATKNFDSIYFTMIGGIACYLSEKFIKKELVAFEDLGAETIYKFQIKELPLRVEFN